MKGLLLLSVVLLALVVPPGAAHSEYLPGLLRMLPAGARATWKASVQGRAGDEPFLRSAKAITQSGTNAEAYW